MSKPVEVLLAPDLSDRLDAYAASERADAGELIATIVDQGLWAQERGLLPPGHRDSTRAAAEIAEVIKYRLLTLPSGAEPVKGLTEELVWDLAAHIAGAIEEFGRGPSPRDDAGRYDHADNRLCVCGHRRADHTAARVRVNGKMHHPCIAHDVGGSDTYCDCNCFRKASK